MNDLTIVSSKSRFFFIISLTKIIQGVFNSISLILGIVFLKIMSEKLLNSLDQIKVQSFHIWAKIKIVVINKYKNFVFPAVSVMLPCFEGFNNSQKLTIISLVSYFGQNYCTEEVDYRVQLTQAVQC